MTACPAEAHSSTRNSAPKETPSDGVAVPSSCGTSQIPPRPPSSSPDVAKAPVTNPCQ